LNSIISKSNEPKPPVAVTCTVAALADVGAVVTTKLKLVGGVKAGVITFGNVKPLASLHLLL
jgi:hypothetical protein